MNRSQLPDAFSKTLESKPRQSCIQHLQQEEDNKVGGSTVNRLSRVFETTNLDKNKAKPPPLKATPLSKPKVEIEPNIDQTPLAFKDIRARFQEESSIPLNQVYRLNEVLPEVIL